MVGSVREIEGFRFGSVRSEGIRLLGRLSISLSFRLIGFHSVAEGDFLVVIGAKGAVGAIAWSSRRRFRITAGDLLKRSLSRVIAEHVFEGLIDSFRRRRWRHHVGLVETMRNHRLRASGKPCERSYGLKRV